MPTLDVSDVLLSPEFADTINITRRLQAIDNSGQTSVTESCVTAVGVITIAPVERLGQDTDAQLSNNVITVHAYALQMYDAVNNNGNQYQPDIVNYNGNMYLVKKVFNWSRYGTGFTMAEAELYQFETTAQ